MSQETTGLLIIDMQNDFLGHRDETPYTESRLPGAPHTAALRVVGGKEVADTVTNVVREKGEGFKKIFVSEDRHKKRHSATSGNWLNRDYGHPKPFGLISADEVGNGTWRFGDDADNEKVYAYLKAYEAIGGKHIIWPEHCVEDTWGAQTYGRLQIALGRWQARTGSELDVFGKGSALIPEHFGAFWAEVQDPNDPSTQPNQPILQSLGTLDRIVVVGLALDYCVRRSIEQLLEFFGVEFAKKIVIFTDCTAAIDQKAGEAFLAKLRELGATVTTSTEYFTHAA